MSAAPWGSAGILPISWAYVRLMGGEGLTRATQVADPRRQLRRGPARRRTTRCSTPAGPGWSRTSASSTCAPITKETGVTVDDVAKRLIDYGFHAPTMSFPVAGTLMIEPTESEDLAELDRFCDAMIAIRGEIDAGRRPASWTPTDNPLRGAPHTAAALAGEWAHGYSRAEAVFPAGVDPADEVLAAGAPDRRRLRRPQPRLLLPAAGRYDSVTPS